MGQKSSRQCFGLLSHPELGLCVPFRLPGLPSPGAAYGQQGSNGQHRCLDGRSRPSSSASHPCVSVASASPFRPLPLLPEPPVCLSPAGVRIPLVSAARDLSGGGGEEEEGATGVFRLQEGAWEAWRGRRPIYKDPACSTGPTKSYQQQRTPLEEEGLAQKRGPTLPGHCR